MSNTNHLTVHSEGNIFKALGRNSLDVQRQMTPEEIDSESNTVPNISKATVLEALPDSSRHVLGTFDGEENDTDENLDLSLLLPEDLMDSIAELENTSYTTYLVHENAFIDAIFVFEDFCTLDLKLIIPLKFGGRICVKRPMYTKLFHLKDNVELES